MQPSASAHRPSGKCDAGLINAAFHCPFVFGCFLVSMQQGSWQKPSTGHAGHAGLDFVSRRRKRCMGLAQRSGNSRLPFGPEFLFLNLQQSARSVPFSHDYVRCFCYLLVVLLQTSMQESEQPRD